MEDQALDKIDDWHPVCHLDVLEKDRPFGTQVGATHVALFKLEDGVFATHGVCTHAFALLSKGFMEGDTIECPLHEGRFDIRTGKCLARPPVRDLRTYPVKIENGKVFVQLPPTPDADEPRIASDRAGENDGKSDGRTAGPGK